MKQTEAERAIKERVVQVLSECKISVNKLAMACEISQTTLNDQINGNSKISAATLLALADFRKDISAEWLLRGVGNMYVQNTTQQEDSELIEALHARIAEQANYIADLRHIARLTDKR